jgi:hypothetical protein
MMHRTQIYLQDDLHAQLKMQAYQLGISLSELIRQTLVKATSEKPATDVRAFFNVLPVAESFATTEPENYVRNLRAASRLLRADAV